MVRDFLSKSKPEIKFLKEIFYVLQGEIESVIFLCPITCAQDILKLLFESYIVINYNRGQSTGMRAIY